VFLPSVDKYLPIKKIGSSAAGNVLTSCPKQCRRTSFYDRKESRVFAKGKNNVQNMFVNLHWQSPIQKFAKKVFVSSFCVTIGSHSAVIE